MYRCIFFNLPRKSCGVYKRKKKKENGTKDKKKGERVSDLKKNVTSKRRIKELINLND